MIRRINWSEVSLRRPFDWYFSGHRNGYGSVGLSSNATAMLSALSHFSVILSGSTGTLSVMARTTSSRISTFSRLILGVTLKICFELVYCSNT